jgi:hypothetical protein
MRRIPGGLASLCFLALLSASSPSVLVAQISLDVGPTVGFYASLTTTEGPRAPGLPAVPTATWKQDAAVAYGGEATVWLSGRIGIGGSYLYSPSRVSVTGNGAFASNEQQSASVQIATARATFSFDVGKNPVYLSGGVGRIMRGGSAYEDLDDPANTAAVFGVGTALKIARQLRVNLGMDVLFYSLQLKTSSASFPSHTQADVVGRVGLLYRLGG